MSFRGVVWFIFTSFLTFLAELGHLIVRGGSMVERAAVPEPECESLKAKALA